LDEKLDLKSLHTMLQSYRRLLEKERQHNLLVQFDTFMEQIGVSNESDSEEYFEDFMSMLNVLEDKDLLAKDKMKQAVESDFFHQIMSVKTSFREREMRKLTHQLCDFIDKSAANAVDDDSFLQSLLANSLRQAANAIESTIREERSEGQTMNEVWVDALKVGLSFMK
jgi:hypothetical protein|tara:strand:- start:9568 stop:10071 length:504 start_codon:yes stop_codon:yes gene_type:complete